MAQCVDVRRERVSAGDRFLLDTKRAVHFHVLVDLWYIFRCPRPAGDRR